MIKEQDPMNGLKGLQNAIDNGYQMDKVITGTSKSGVRFCRDMNGKRLTFAKVRKNKVQSFLAFSIGGGLYESEIWFGIYYAVPVHLRGKNRMEKLYSIAIKDIRKSINNNFYVEAIVDQDNDASNYIAKKLLSGVIKQSVDKLSGIPINAYYKLYKAKKS